MIHTTRFTGKMKKIKKAESIENVVSRMIRKTKAEQKDELLTKEEYEIRLRENLYREQQ